jgi:hypothetical protein
MVAFDRCASHFGQPHDIVGSPADSPVALARRALQTGSVVDDDATASIATGLLEPGPRPQALAGTSLEPRELAVESARRRTIRRVRFLGGAVVAEVD